jgi:hypothetical protein
VGFSAASASAVDQNLLAELTGILVLDMVGTGFSISAEGRLVSRRDPTLQIIVRDAEQTACVVDVYGMRDRQDAPARSERYRFGRIERTEAENYITEEHKAALLQAYGDGVKCPLSGPPDAPIQGECSNTAAFITDPAFLDFKHRALGWIEQNCGKSR